MSQQLIEYARTGDIENLKKLLKEDVDVNIRDAEGRTAVLEATRYNYPKIVDILIQHGADVNIQDLYRNNVLLHAGATGYLEIVKLAIAAGADTKLTNRYGGIAIIPAAERAHVEVIEELLTYSDSDVNHINNLHWTALMEAVILGDGGVRHQKAVEVLLKHGADPNIADRDGITPLQHAEQLGYTEIALLLKAADA